MNKHSFGMAVRMARVEQGIKQNKLAEMTGKKPNSIALIEADERKPSYEMICRLCAALKRTPTDLMGDCQDANS